MPPGRRLALSDGRRSDPLRCRRGGLHGTVEVLGVIFSAEDDGYAVLEVQDAESGEDSPWSARSPT